MPRRYLNRKIRTKPPDEEAVRKYLRFLSGRQLFFAPETLPRLDSPHLFGNDHAIELEVGCGTGEFLCALAAEHPETNYVGADLHLRALHKAVNTAASRCLDNILLMSADVKLLHALFVTESLGAVYLHFPDPNLEPRFRRRRIFTPTFLDHVLCALVQGGRLSVMTDHHTYFSELLEIAERDPRWEKTHAERYLIGFETAVKSRFQRIWEGHGLPTFRFELRKPVRPDVR